MGESPYRNELAVRSQVAWSQLKRVYIWTAGVLFDETFLQNRNNWKMGAPPW